MIRRPPRSTLDRSSAASDVYKRQVQNDFFVKVGAEFTASNFNLRKLVVALVRSPYYRAKTGELAKEALSLIHISEPTRPY